MNSSQITKHVIKAGIKYRIFCILKTTLWPTYLAQPSIFPCGLAVLLQSGPSTDFLLLYRPGFFGHWFVDNHAAISTATQASFRAWAGVR
jgi:hypothetical protein